MPFAEQLNSALTHRYRIDREIGSGGMAIVYLAHDLRHDRPVALKVLKPDIGAVLGGPRFLEEIRVTANLQHPNLLPLFDSGEADGLLFYVMPFVEGESLRSRLNREKQLPIQEAVHIAASVAGALEYAHTQGVIHRDLKPENILIQSGQPMVADFGIALAVSRAGGERITQTGISLGTPHYMSPEQATGDRIIDARSDIYSLAAMLFEMLIGDPPHTGGTVQSVIAKVLTEPAASVRVVRPNVPEHIADAVARGLEKLPADRWPTAGAFAEGLTGARRVTLLEAPSPSSRQRGLVLARPGVMALAGACAIAGAIGGFVVASRLRPERNTRVSWFELSLPDSVGIQDAGPPLALSPDGAVVAYVGGSDQSLFVRAFAEPTLRRLSGTEGAQCPSFSPDGEWILFVARGRLHKARVGGGPPTSIADSAGVCAVWTDRNEIVFDFRQDLYRVSANGGPISLVRRADSAARIGRMLVSQALPGGQAALISVSENQILDWQTGVVSLANGAITRLMPKSTGPKYTPQYSRGYLVYGENGSVLAAPFSLRNLRLTGNPTRLLQDTISAFATSTSGSLAYISAARATARLVAVAPNGRERPLYASANVSRMGVPETNILDTASYAWPRLSPDGRHVAMEVRTGLFNWDIWVYDLIEGSVSRLTTNFSGIRPAGWTADGHSVVFIKLDSASLSAPSRLVMQPWDASAPPQELTRLPPNVLEATVSPARDYAAYTVIDRDHSRLWLTRLASSAPPRAMGNGHVDKEARFSPNGRMLAYTSDETGRSEVYIQPLAGATSRVQVSTAGAGQPVWSADGRALYYRTAYHLMRAMLSINPEIRVARRDTLFKDVYAVHDRTNYDVFARGDELLMIRVTPGTPRGGIVLDWPGLVAERGRAR